MGNKDRYHCAHCGDGFPNITEHMVHVTKQHDVGFVPKGCRITRQPSCWRCATEMRRDLADQGNFVCDACGFTLEREKEEYLTRLEQEKIDRGEDVSRYRLSDEEVAINEETRRWLP